MNFLHLLSANVYSIDAVYAITTFQRPVFPLYDAAEKSLDNLWTKFDKHTKHRLRALEDDLQGFAILNDLENGRTLLEVVSKTRIVLESYSLFFRDPHCGIDMIDVMASRRVVQHAAVSSEPGVHPLYKVARVTLIAFTTECLSSLYPGHLFHRNVARTLLTLMEDCEGFRSCSRVPGFLLWVNMLGGFTARGMPLRFRYAEHLRKGPIEPIHKNWDLVLAISQQYLPFVFDHELGCKQFWDEACTYLSQDEY